MITSSRPWLTTWGDDPCLVVDTVELDEDEDVPPEAVERGWTTVVIKEELQGVVGNLEEQVANPDLAMILRATAHYVDNDAYIELP